MESYFNFYESGQCDKCGNSVDNCICKHAIKFKKSIVNKEIDFSELLTTCPNGNPGWKVGSTACTTYCAQFIYKNKNKQIVYCRKQHNGNKK